MKTYGLKKINGLVISSLGDVIKLEGSRTIRVRARLDAAVVAGPQDPRGTPHRAKHHEANLVKLRKRLKYKQKLVDCAKARWEKLMKAEAEAEAEAKVKAEAADATAGATHG